MRLPSKPSSTELRTSVLTLRRAAEEVEGGVGVDALSAHEDALGVVDDRPAHQRGLEGVGEVAGFPGQQGVRRQGGGRFGEPGRASSSSEK
jgi:hypothetical protein